MDPAERTVQAAIDDLKQRRLARETGLGRAEVCFTADLERGKRLAARMLDMNLCDFRLISCKEGVKSAPTVTEFLIHV